MLNNIKYNLIFVFLFAMLMSLTQTYASSEKLYGYPVKVTNSSVNPPTFSNDQWIAQRTIHFENGLYAVRNTTWEHESEAFREIGNSIPKQVTITYHSGDMFFLESKDPEQSTIAELWIDPQHPFHLPHIMSLNAKRILLGSGPFSGKPAWHYTIELNDGSVWEGVEREQHHGWLAGDEIICIGTKFRPIFINKTRILHRDSGYHKVNREDILRVLQH